MNTEILPTLIQIVVDELVVHESEVTGRTRLHGTDFMTNAHLVEIAMEAETQFGVEIPEEELAGLRTVSDLAAFLAHELQ